MFKAEQISRIRAVLMSITALACFLYAVLALVQNRPDPILWWIPGGFGAGSAVLIAVIYALAGRTEMRAVMDELYMATITKAAAQAYWLSLAMFVAISALVVWAGYDWTTAYAVHGTFLGGSFLALFVWHDQRLG